MGSPHCWKYHQFSPLCIQRTYALLNGTVHLLLLLLVLLLLLLQVVLLLLFLLLLQLRQLLLLLTEEIILCVVYYDLCSRTQEALLFQSKHIWEDEVTLTDWALTAADSVLAKSDRSHSVGGHGGHYPGASRRQKLTAVVCLSIQVGYHDPLRPVPQVFGITHLHIGTNKITVKWTVNCLTMVISDLCRSDPLDLVVFHN